MTRSLVTKYIRIDKNGIPKYRRRVPQSLQRVLGKTEFVKVLGKSEQEVLRNYAPYHDHVEQLLRAADPTANASELVTIKADIEAQFAELDLDPYSSGRSEGERASRSEEADRILSQYPREAQTGQPDLNDVTLKDGASIDRHPQY